MACDSGNFHKLVHVEGCMAKKLPDAEMFKAIFDAMFAFESLPVRYERTRDGWAGYRGNRRITKFRFSEEAAREEVTAQDSRNVPIV